MDSARPLVEREAGLGAMPGRTTGGRNVMGPWAWIWMLIWIAALLFMVWLIVRGTTDRPAADDATTILRARFARGEISQDEFERARDALLSDRREFTR
jgi:putative membrane protein